MCLARGLSLMARLNTLLKVRRGGLISGHDYQFQSQAMGGAPRREWRHSMPPQPSGMRGFGPGLLHARSGGASLPPLRAQWQHVALPVGGLCQDVAHGVPLSISR